MKRENLVAYCAGIFDGEGSVSANDGCVRMSVAMIDREPLQALFSAFGGKLYGPRKGTNAPLYVWQITGWRKVESVYLEIAPYLCARRIAQWARVSAGPRAKERIPVDRPPPCGFDRDSGSNAGHVNHYKRGEKACPDCYHAAKTYMQNRRSKKRESAN